ncbi:GDSL lipase/acylhydrolase [Pyronema omphalodes]|nr:GDSL lipase/acylhydrolase [Pyronema omphalodes]
MKLLSLLTLATSAILAAAAPSDEARHGNGVPKTILAFGDSYTDEGRLNYMIANNGSYPPDGYISPDTAVTASGGRSWARYAAYYTGATLYNYAVSGAVCSNEITPRYTAWLHGNFPSVREYEVPQFAKDLKAGDVKLDWKNTVSVLWIGTNDLGGDLLLGHSQVPGKTMVDYTRCVWEQLETLYKMGSRKFVLINVAALELSPLYIAGGVPGPNRFWTLKGDNTTDISSRMTENVAAVNEIFSLRAETHKMKGAKVAILNANGLFRDVWHHPENYLNGTEPLNVKGWTNHCDINFENCWQEQPENRDAYMWFDELHPSEQVGRVLAKEFTKVVEGKKTAKYFD